MIYLFNKEKGEFKEYKSLNKQVDVKTKPESKVPSSETLSGGEMTLFPPLDFYTLNTYRDKSETHVGCLNFKYRNLFLKGFTLNNMQDNIKPIESLNIVANRSG